MFDLNYRFIYANKALLTMWGKTWDKAIGRNLLENGYEPWHAAMHEQEIDQVVATKQQIRGEVSFPHAVLGTRIYDYIFTPVINDIGEVEAVAGTTRDITDIKTVEAAMAESESRFRILAETLPQMIWVSDAKGINEYYSHNWKIYSGIENINEAWKYMVHAEDEKVSREAFVKARILGTPFEYEVRLKNKDGEYFWHSSVAEPVKDSSGKVVKWVGALTNIHQQKTTLEGVKALMAKKDEFMSIASHELKTPVTTVKANLQLIERMLKNPQKASSGQLKTFVKLANKQVIKLVRLIEELLDVTRINAGKITLNKSNFYIGEVIQESIEQISAEYRSHLIKFEGETQIPVRADRYRIEQVLNNLLSNAIKYSPEADKVILKTKTTGDTLTVSIQDFGIGIPLDKKQQIFDRFYRVNDNSLRFNGIGLGLFISSEIVRRHGGDLGVISELGEGSEFWFTLPLK